MKSPIAKILTKFTKAFSSVAKGVAVGILANLDDDSQVRATVEHVWMAYAAADHFGKAVKMAIKASYEVGVGRSIKLFPSFLADAWDDSGMKLSEKLHGADKEMRAEIVKTIKGQLKQNQHAMTAARALYDGYNAGHVTRKQEIPKYLGKIVAFARRSDLSDNDRAELLRMVRRAQKQVDKLGLNGAPNQALKTAYSQLLDAVTDGSEKALTRAVHTAVEEKSRYVAERIARTEAARAWADGFVERYMDNDRVVAFQWRLSSRHPHVDICDMYADANLYGLGKGIYPKDATPRLPVHPHCLCHLAPIYASELNGRVPIDNLTEGGRAWLDQQSLKHRQEILGVAGNRMYEQGADWTTVAKNYSDEKLQKPHQDSA